MFLGGLRAKSILRKIKEQVANRSYEYKKASLLKIGIIQTEHQHIDEAGVALLAETLEVKSEDITIITYVKKASKEELASGSLFSEHQIGWKGQPKHEVLKSFTNTPFDIVVSYYTTSDLGLLATTAYSKARFKVGLNTEISGLNDLVIEGVIGDFTLFVKELKKYLQILKIAI